MPVGLYEHFLHRPVKPSLFELSLWKPPSLFHLLHLVHNFLLGFSLSHVRDSICFELKRQRMVVLFGHLEFIFYTLNRRAEMSI